VRQAPGRQPRLAWFPHEAQTTFPVGYAVPVDLGTALGLTGFGAVLFALALWITKGALVKAVEHAAAKELETMRHGFAKELADKRESFERGLQTARDGAARDLETFKAELTLDAEMRRQVAARRVEAVHQISLQVKAAYLRWLPSGPGERDELEFLRKAITSHEHFFPEETAKALKSFANALGRARATYDKKPAAGVVDTISAEYHSIMALLRRELGITTPAATPVRDADTGGDATTRKEP